MCEEQIILHFVKKDLKITTLQKIKELMKISSFFCAKIYSYIDKKFH